ncbi:unnamed protein product [Psylliodes chrysocephalus]|uniref:Uncharacterized protein n=1 Tax=Psylliodes chrysocephalus TaxID=3402493 RepID=A0A9P0G817_9CUCU|nr:unnamed protein product [Psylliodes chrysocephala]
MINIFSIVMIVFVFTMLASSWMCVNCDCINDTKGFNVTARKKSNTDILSMILPNLAMPFIMQAMFLPLVLVFMKLSVLKSILIGKLGILIWIYNIIHNSSNPPGALYSHSVDIKHHGNAGDNKYGGYSKRRKRR